MSDCKKLGARELFLLPCIFIGFSFFIGLVGCGTTKPAQQESAPTRYSLSGRVVNIDKAKSQVMIDAKSIPGFMPAMKMGYPVKDPNLLDTLSPDEEVTADVVVASNGFWLENIVVVKAPDQSTAPADKDAHPAPPLPGKQ